MIDTMSKQGMIPSSLIRVSA